MMRAMMAIYKRELNSYFLSPIAYVLAGIYLLLSSWFFYFSTIFSQNASMDNVFGNMIFIFLLITPLLTMRLLAEERKSGTDQLLFTSPVKISKIVLGKYFAAVTIYVVILLITLIYPIILYYFSRIDLGPVLSGYLGLLLIGGAFLSVGLFSSSLTENQIIASIVAFGILLLTWVVSWGSTALSGTTQRVLDYLGVLNHFDQFQVGVIDTSNITYYLSYIIIFLLLTILVLHNRKWSRG